MYFSYGNTSQLQGHPYYMLEMSNDSFDAIKSTSIELALRRLIVAIPEIFGSSPCELFIPVSNRDLNVFELKHGPLIYVRGDFKKCLGLKRVNGFLGLYTNKDSGRSKDALSCEDGEYIQGLIKACKEAHESRYVGIQKGSFVRLIDGEARDYCGIVKSIAGNKVVVIIKLECTELHVSTSKGNCKVLDTSHRDYYYGLEETC